MAHQDQDQKKSEKEVAAQWAATHAKSDQLAQCQEQMQEWKEKYLRSSADFDNFKKRVERERAQWIRMSQSNVFHEILAIIDDFDRALEEGKKREVTQDAGDWLAGFELIKNGLDSVLTKFEVAPITQVSEFDPNLHEAVAQVESPNHETGQIVSVLQKGYIFKDEVLRPAKVTVAK